MNDEITEKLRRLFVYAKDPRTPLEEARNAAREYLRRATPERLRTLYAKAVDESHPDDARAAALDYVREGGTPPGAAVAPPGSAIVPIAEIEAYNRQLAEFDRLAKSYEARALRAEKLVADFERQIAQALAAQGEPGIPSMRRRRAPAVRNPYSDPFPFYEGPNMADDDFDDDDGAPW